MDKFGIDHTAAFMIRFLGAFFLAWILMAIYIMFVRPNGVEGTWSFFNLIFSFIKRLFVSNISNEEKLKLLLFNSGVGDKKLNFSLKYFERFFSEKISIVKIVVDKRIPKI